MSCPHGSQDPCGSGACRTQTAELRDLRAKLALAEDLARAVEAAWDASAIQMHGHMRPGTNCAECQGVIALGQTLALYRAACPKKEGE